MAQTTEILQVASATHALLEPVAILSALCTEFALTMHASVTSFRVTKAPCVKLPVVLGGLRTAATMGPATRQPKPALVIQHGLGPPVTSQTVPAPLTVMVEAPVSHLRMTMKHRSVIALKDGWVLPVSYLVNLELQQVIIYADVTRATMDLPVTCYALITLHSVLMINVIVGLRVGEETTAKEKVVLGIREIARDMDNVCLLELVFVIQDGVVRLMLPVSLPLIFFIFILSLMLRVNDQTFHPM